MGYDLLLGQYEGTVGEKSRIALPKRFREVLGDKLIITQGYEKSLMLVSEKGWRALLKGTEGKPFIQSEAREMQRFLLGSASFVQLDGKGRFIIPSYLKIYAQIAQDVIFIGLSRYVEIWEKKRWVAYSQQLAQKIDILAKQLTKNDREKE